MTAEFVERQLRQPLRVKARALCDGLGASIEEAELESAVVAASTDKDEDGA